MAVPEKFYKVILDYKESEIKAVGFIVPHEDGGGELFLFLVSTAYAVGSGTGGSGAGAGFDYSFLAPLLLVAALLYFLLIRPHQRRETA